MALKTRQDYLAALRKLRPNIYKFGELIEDVKKTGCSIILTTHYMEEAEYLSDRIAVMDKGKIIASK